MKILIDICHPAHVHMFRNVAKRFLSENHSVLFTTRIKDVEKQLLEAYGFEYISFGKNYKKPIWKIWGIFKFDLKLLLISLRFKPDLFLSMTSIYAAHVAYLLRKPHVLLTDTEHAGWQHKLSFRFSTAILTPDSFFKKIGPKHVTYNSYHELAYLHPDLFNPDKNLIKNISDKSGDGYVLVRFVSWSASHDIGHRGIPLDYKLELVRRLSKYAHIVISSEGKLPEQLEQYRINIPPEQIHHALAFAKLVITEGTTMGSESGMLGTPAIVVNDFNLGCINEQEEKYGIIIRLGSYHGLIEKATELLSQADLKEKWEEKSKRLIMDKLNLTEFLYDYLISNYLKKP